MYDSAQSPSIAFPSAPPPSPAGHPSTFPAGADRSAGCRRSTFGRRSTLGIPSTLRIIALLLLAWVIPALPGLPGGAAVAAAEEGETPPLVGVVDRGEIEAHVPAWVAAQVEAEPDAEAARALLEVEPGATVTVFLGTWCSDSKRELARLWRAFDEAGIDPAGEMGTEPPFALEYVAVDRDKHEPAHRTAGVGLDFVPTFVVRRDGEEVGRMVEVSPHGIEHDLLALLTGEATGVVSAREDLGGDGDDQDGDDQDGDDQDGDDQDGEDGRR